MPALNMGSPAAPAANPITGKFVMMSPFSGPKGSLFDASKFDPTTGVKSKDVSNFSTGALNTGIGFGANRVLNVSNGTAPATAAQAIKNATFTDDQTPGLTLPNNTVAPDARLTAIGGGRSNIVGGGATGLGVSTPAPYTAVPLYGFGAGASRDGGAGPVFTGFAVKMVTAAGAVADGAVIEAGWVNRSGVAMVATDSAFGSAAAASVGPTLLEEEEEPEPEEEEEEEP